MPLHSHDQPTANFGGVVATLGWSTKGQAVIRTVGGRTKPKVYVFDPDTRDWIGDPPNYDFGQRLIQTFGL